MTHERQDKDVLQESCRKTLLFDEPLVRQPNKGQKENAK